MIISSFLVFNTELIMANLSLCSAKHLFTMVNHKSIISLKICPIPPPFPLPFGNDHIQKKLTFITVSVVGTTFEEAAASEDSRLFCFGVEVSGSSFAFLGCFGLAWEILLSGWSVPNEWSLSCIIKRHQILQSESRNLHHVKFCSLFS